MNNNRLKNLTQEQFQSLHSLIEKLEETGLSQTEREVLCIAFVITTLVANCFD